MKKLFLSAACLCSLASAFAADWKPAAGPLMTKWAKDVKPSKVLPEYPRPQMVRAEWQNLNGLWDYAITAQDAPTPTQWAGKILVPFPVQSALSGVMTNVSENQRLWYARKFNIPRGWQGKRVLLNFGAVDWDTTVWVNGKEMGAASFALHASTALYSVTTWSCFKVSPAFSPAFTRLEWPSSSTAQ